MPRETAEQKLARMTALEREIWAAGGAVAGIDEVGRGPLAGPVFAACIVIPEHRLVPGVDDSKKLSEKKREALYGPLLDAADYVRVARLEARDIDRINILAATRLCMEKCAEGARGPVFLIDALTGLRLPGAQRALVHGDANSYMIAAASIVAKVTRDRWMAELDARYPGYGFARNKGYGTDEHIAALKKIGPCPEHRRTFIDHFCGEAYPVPPKTRDELAGFFSPGKEPSPRRSSATSGAERRCRAENDPQETHVLGDAGCGS